MTQVTAQIPVVQKVAKYTPVGRVLENLLYVYARAETAYGILAKPAKTPILATLFVLISVGATAFPVVPKTANWIAMPALQSQL